MATLIHRLSRSRIDYRQIYRIGRSLASESATIHGKLVYPPFQVRSVLVPAGSVTGFNDMITGNQRKFYLLGGKGGVGKTSCAASLAVKFANNGHPTIVVSTDPAHSLSDSFAQDLTGGTLVPVQGVDSPLFALELNPENAKEEFRTAQKAGGGNGVKDLMDSMGLGMLSDQVRNVLSEYSKFTRIVFDTAPTGHTLRFLSLPDFMDASIGKLLKMKKKLASATSALKSVFGKGGGQQEEHTSDKLDKLRESMHKVRDLFRDADSTEFIIVTIPTVMAVSESSRLHGSLKKESVPVHRLIVNQCLPPSATSDCKFCAMRRKDQTRALDMIEKDPGLGSLKLIKAPLFDAEIRGVPALKFMGDTVWK
ncbi:ATPase GET3B [Linum perenne]